MNFVSHILNKTPVCLQSNNNNDESAVSSSLVDVPLLDERYLPFFLEKLIWLATKTKRKYTIAGYQKSQNIDFKAFSSLGSQAKLVVTKYSSFALEFDVTYFVFVSCHYALCSDLRHFVDFFWSHTRGNLL